MNYDLAKLVGTVIKKKRCIRNIHYISMQAALQCHLAFTTAPRIAGLFSGLNLLCPVNGLSHNGLWPKRSTTYFETVTKHTYNFRSNLR